MKTIAVTGVTGFVGKRFIQYNKEKYRLVPLMLRGIQPAALDMKGLDAVVHLAGKAHQMEPVADNVYFEVNFQLSAALAARAKEQGVPHFIYISSTKVYGDNIETVLNEQSPCHPSDAYGASKLKAEESLQAMASPSFTVAILRPPLVYGPGVKGNMIKLLQLAAKKIPLPFGNTRNARSMVFVDNLVALINAIIDQQAGGVFAAGDRHPVSTDALIGMMRKAMNNPLPLVSVPFFIRGMLKKLRPALYIRLFGSFVVDNSATNRRLQFTPPAVTEEGIEVMVNWFKHDYHKKN